MPNEPDYKTAYETLARAIEEAERILYKADLMTSAGLSMQKGKELEEDVMEEIRRLNSQP